MEKFGIFELLDTLSAILGDEDAATAAPSVPAERSEPSLTDKAFLPPEYKGGENADALSSFLNKHDETVKRIGKKK